MPNLLENNAYRVLGLDVTASQKEILRRYKEISNLFKIDEHPKYNLDLNLPENFRNEETLKYALKRLQTPKDNIREYFFWFSISNTNDKRALGYLADGDFKKAIQVWDSLSESDTVTSFFYKKNLAVIYCLLLQKEDNLKYLKNSLSIWNELVNSERFWLAFSKAYESQNEQTAGQEALSLKEVIKKDISDVYADLSKTHKNPEYVKDFQAIFNVHGEGTEKGVLQPIYQQIHSKLDELRRIRTEVDDGQPVDSKMIELEHEIASIRVLLDKLRKNGLYDDAETKVIRDHVAEAIQLKSVELHNNGAHFEESEKLIKIAIGISGTESFKSQLTDDRGKIQKSAEADSKDLLIVNIPGFLSSNNVEFKPRFVEYNGQKILYKKATQISFYGTVSQYSATYSIFLASDEGKIAFSVSDAPTWNRIVGLLSQGVIPVIVKDYVDRIFDKGETICIGDAQFDKKGYSHPKFWGGTESVLWSDSPFYLPQLYKGNVFLYKRINGRIKSFGRVSMSLPNAVILPALVQACLNRAVILKIHIPTAEEIRRPVPTATQSSSMVGTATATKEASVPLEGSQEYFDKIDREQRPELLKEFEDNGGRKLSKAELDALKEIKEGKH